MSIKKTDIEPNLFIFKKNSKIKLKNIKKNNLI
jgi:hypothetical protein